jgi:hypothetical protein
MTGRVRTALIAVVAAATLAFAQAAFAANTATISVWHTPMVLAGSQSTTIHIGVPQTTDGIAQINIFAPSGYGAVLNQPAGMGIGTVSATALAHDGGLTLPLSGPVTTDDPAKHTADACSPGTNAAVWNMNLSVAGQTLVVPIYVNPTSGAATALGAYKLTICLPPWDVPVGTPGRSFEGAQLLDAKFTVNKVFTTPAAAGLLKWEALFTPYTPGKGTPNPVAMFEALAFVPVPISLAVKASYVKKSGTWRLVGTAKEGGLGVGDVTLKIWQGLTAKSVKPKAATTTTASGAFTASGRLIVKKRTYFQVSAAVGERDYTASGCQNPLTALAPAGCVSATLSPWAAKSIVVSVKP